MSTTGVAIIGCGQWGMNHVRVFSDLPDVQVVAVCDQRQARLAEVRRQFPAVHLMATVDEVLERKDVDAVIVCTEAASHYPIVQRSLMEGRHVLVEKPITTRSSEAEDLMNLANSHELTLMVGHIFLYNPAVIKLKSLISEGEVGRVYYMYSRRTNLGPIRRDVNALWDLAPHDVSIFNYLLDDSPEWVSAVGARVLGNGREDVGFISLGYRDGVVGHAHLSWADPHKVREVVVVGSDKRIVFDDLNAQERMRVFEKGIKPIEPEAPDFAEQFMLRDGNIIIPKIEASEPLKNECQHFIQCVQQKCRPLTGGQNGLDVVRVMEAVDSSIARRGAPVPVTQMR
ncbi:MAG: Gfo/Idh/MocA family protein [Anaerolineae bacterium]